MVFAATEVPLLVVAQEKGEKEKPLVGVRRNRSRYEGGPHFTKKSVKTACISGSRREYCVEVHSDQLAHEP